MLDEMLSKLWWNPLQIFVSPWKHVFELFQYIRRKIVICNRLFAIVIIANDILQSQTIIIYTYYSSKQ